MDTGLRVTLTVARVLRVFLADPAEPRYGFDLMERTGMPSGSLYPVLARLDRAGWITGHREDLDPVAAGRPPRRYFTLTPEGERLARARVAQLAHEFAPPVPRPHLQGGYA
jgi:PadR family transcriptional regulator, regulatory protein PadR